MSTATHGGPPLTWCFLERTTDSECDPNLGKALNSLQPMPFRMRLKQSRAGRRSGENSGPGRPSAGRRSCRCVAVVRGRLGANHRPGVPGAA